MTMQVQKLIRPIYPPDDTARGAGCVCNHRSSLPGPSHHPACPIYQEER